MIVYYSNHYINKQFKFDTVNKAQLVHKKVSKCLPFVKFRSPMPLTQTLLESNHSTKYVNAVRTGIPANLAESSSLCWTTDTWDSVTYSNGGMLSAAITAMFDGISGTLSSGLHHARRNYGTGFCTFNGLAIAANEMTFRGIRNILIIDVDAHCGGGTVSMTEDNPNIFQFDLSTSKVDIYPNNKRRKTFMSHGYDYLDRLDDLLLTVDNIGVKFGLCLYNAGVDSHEKCFIGGLSGINAEVLAERDKRVFTWCKTRNIPVAFTLAGGYANDEFPLNTVADLHMSTIREALSIY